MESRGRTTLKQELIKLDKTIKHAIKICLEDANMYWDLDESKIGKDITTYNDCKSITDYIYLKIKEYFIFNYFIRALERSSRFITDNYEVNIVSNPNLFESDYIDKYLFYKNDYKYDSNLSSTQNHSNYDNILINIRKHLLANMKNISDYTHGNEIDIIENYIQNQEILSEDSLKNFSYWINNNFNQYVFLCGSTPIKYISFLNEEERRRVPMFFEYDIVLFTDLFFKKPNHLSKANTNINSLKKNQDNNNIESLIETYNQSIQIINKFEDKFIANEDYIRFNALKYYFNSIYANDFFKAENSTFLQYICDFINFKELVNYSKIIKKNQQQLIMQDFKLNKETTTITSYLQFINILEFGIKYNIDFSEFDSLLNKFFSGINRDFIINKHNIQSFCTFLFLLNNNTSLQKLDINFFNLLDDIENIIDILNNELAKLNNQNNDIKLINKGSKLFKKNYLLFSYLFLYPFRHPNYSIQG